MKRSVVVLFVVTLCATTASAQKSTGTIKGHIRLSGAVPGNPIIRMGMDPMCSAMNAGERVVQEIVSADEHGNLANVFVRLQGSFPRTPVPSQPVTIDQRRCVYTPRVVGMRVGQALQVKNDDSIAHNVHGVSTTYVGVVTNPYFAVSRDLVKKIVKVTAGGTAMVDLIYTGNEKPSGPGAP